MGETSQNYWASKPPGEIGPEIWKRIEYYYQYLRKANRLTMWRRIYEGYYRGAMTSASTMSTGEQGELIQLDVNDFRNIIQHMLVMTTSQPPSFEPKATNSDHKSQAQTILASGLLEYYLREKRLDRYTYKALELSCLADEGFILKEWNRRGGLDYAGDPATGEVVKEGDIQLGAYHPIDVVRDYTKESPDDHEWYCIRVWTNRWNLIARFPNMREEILRLPSKNAKMEFPRLNTGWDVYDSDEVAVFRFFHSKTDAMPEGRVVLLCSSSCVLVDGPLPYRNNPVYRVAGAEQYGTEHGYTVSYDLSPLQIGQNALFSAIASNHAALGIQNIWSEEGSGLTTNQLVGGLNHLQTRPGAPKPEPLNLLQTSPETFKFVEMLIAAQERISGVNSVQRGNPEANLKSGSALALVQSRALEFSMGLQLAYKSMLEDLGMGILTLLRDFAQVPRVAMIAGKANRTLMKEFTGDDLDQINRVVVDMGSALSRTTAGRVAIADQLLQSGMITDPDQYIQVINTGRLDPMIEGKQAALLKIKQENEMLAEGQNPPVIATQNHPLHIAEHQAVLEAADPSDPGATQTIQAATEHMQAHIDAWRQTDPGLLAALKIPPPPPPPAPPAPPGVAGAPPPGPPGPEGAPPPHVGPSHAAPLLDQGRGAPAPPQMPAMPKNPMTGERVPYPGGAPQ